MKKITVTIDTNCINTKAKDPDLNKLEEWHKSGLIEIIKTDVMDTELPDAPEKFKKKSKDYKEDRGVGVCNHSRVNHCVCGGENDNYPHEEFRKILFPNFNNLPEEKQKNAIRDAMHLATHYKYKRDFFVTIDTHFLQVRDKLKEGYGINILKPDECDEKNLKIGV